MQTAWRREEAEYGDDVPIAKICLRNAVVMTELAAYWQRFPYLMVEADAVQAYTIAGAPPHEADGDGESMGGTKT